MKKINLLLLFFYVWHVNGQEKIKPGEVFYLLDQNFSGTTAEKAKYLLHSVKKSDTCWQFDTYTMLGPMVSSEHFKDDKATVLHGEAVYFNAKGTRDSICHFFNGQPDGSCYYLNDTGRIYVQKEFRQGVLLATIDRIKKDSADAAAWKKKVDTTKKVEMESDFPGGQSGWIRYLNKNLQYPQRAQNTGKQGQVVTEFIVDTLGHISNIQIIKSVEYSLDQETLRIIAASPAWIPAFQNGRKVKSYKRQPLTFRLTTN